LTYPLTAIISDLHANIPALDVALEDARRRGAERFVCLGDVIGYGARPLECLDRVMDLVGAGKPSAAAAPATARSGAGSGGLGGEGSPAPPICLLGNHEEAILQSAVDFNPKARAAIEWTRATLNEVQDAERRDRYWDFLGSLRPSDQDELAMYVHGSPRDPVREYALPRDMRSPEKMDANFRLMTRGVCFVGHSHVPAVYFQNGSFHQPRGTEGPFSLSDLELEGDGWRESDKRAIINVGSVGQPRDGDNRLSYVVFDGRELTFIRLEYDHEAAAAEIRAVPELPDFLADRLAIGR
jgi:predicted phosphodiesterase